MNQNKTCDSISYKADQRVYRLHRAVCHCPRMPCSASAPAPGHSSLPAWCCLAIMHSLCAQLRCHVFRNVQGQVTCLIWGGHISCPQGTLWPSCSPTSCVLAGWVGQFSLRKCQACAIIPPPGLEREGSTCLNPSYLQINTRDSNLCKKVRSQ